MIQNTNGLTNEQIGRAFPSVVATQAHESRSQRYLYIPTIQIIDGLRDAGYVPTTAMQAYSRLEGKKPFAKHLLRFRKSSYLGNNEPDVPEVVLVNSHDGTSAYSLLAGIFRCVCTNGLITGDINNTLKVYHRGNILDEVLKATYFIAEEAEVTMQTVAEMKQIMLEPKEQLLLAQYATKARFGEPVIVEGSLSPLPAHDPAALLERRRRADTGNDLYTTLNVIQENVLQGGVRDRGRRHPRTRAIKGIDQTVKVNSLLWQFAQELRAYKLES